MISRAKRLFSSCHGSSNLPTSCNDIDVIEEYANAFRTESYNEFWARVTALTHSNSATKKLVGSTSASRLLSYRLFIDNLLDPDQPTVINLLSLNHNQHDNKHLLLDYFQTTANASNLCAILLKDVDQIRTKFISLKKSLDFLEIAQVSTTSNTTHLPTILARLTEFSKSINPFVSPSTSLTRFGMVKFGCSSLLEQLELRRDKVRAKFQFFNSLKLGTSMFLVALTTSITLIVVTHFIAMTIAMPGVIIGSFRHAALKRLTKVSVQLDAAAKGTYILSRDLDTISRIVARLNDELEHIRTMVKFWMDRAENHLQVQAIKEVARQLKKNDSNFIDQLDELEEHLYLCFMTINRVRNLVVKEIMELHPS